MDRPLPPPYPLSPLVSPQPHPPLTVAQEMPGPLTPALPEKPLRHRPPLSDHLEYPTWETEVVLAKQIQAYWKQNLPRMYQRLKDAGELLPLAERQAQQAIDYAKALMSQQGLSPTEAWHETLDQKVHQPR